MSDLELDRPELLESRCFIAGEWIGSDDSFAVENPATGTAIVRVPRFGKAETERAIGAAHAALPAWSARTAKERANLLRKWFELIIENREDIARIMTAEQGKPLAE